MFNEYTDNLAVLGLVWFGFYFRILLLPWRGTYITYITPQKKRCIPGRWNLFRALPTRPGYKLVDYVTRPQLTVPLIKCCAAVDVCAANWERYYVGYFIIFTFYI